MTYGKCSLTNELTPPQTIMSDIVVYGVPGSPYLRSALLGLHEKQVPFRLAVLDGIAGARTEEHRRRHPFGRVPVLEHGDFGLYETQAILRYIDATFAGISLTEGCARGRPDEPNHGHRRLVRLPVHLRRHHG